MNDESSKVTGKSLPFSEITTPTELIAYLDSSERLKKPSTEHTTALPNRKKQGLQSAKTDYGIFSVKYN